MPARNGRRQVLEKTSRRRQLPPIRMLFAPLRQNFLAFRFQRRAVAGLRPEPRPHDDRAGLLQGGTPVSELQFLAGHPLRFARAREHFHLLQHVAQLRAEGARIAADASAYRAGNPRSESKSRQPFLRGKARQLIQRRSRGDANQPVFPAATGQPRMNAQHRFRDSRVRHQQVRAPAHDAPRNPRRVPAAHDLRRRFRIRNRRQLAAGAAQPERREICQPFLHRRHRTCGTGLLAGAAILLRPAATGLRRRRHRASRPGPPCWRASA